MTREQLIEKILKTHLQVTTRLLPTKGDLKKLTDTQLARLLTIHNQIAELQEEALHLFE